MERAARLILHNLGTCVHVSGVEPYDMCSSVFSVELLRRRLLSIPRPPPSKRVPKDGRKGQEVRYARHSPTSLMEAITMMPTIAAVWGGWAITEIRK